MSAKDDLLCPSATCEAGAILVGIVLPNGKVAVSSTEMVVDADFVKIARSGRPPEARFRFGSKCASGGCGNWSGQKCQVIEKVREEVDRTIQQGTTGHVLPSCAIRDRCRWFSQQGAGACYYCEFVVRDSE
jgi:hypothetical protein